MNEPHPTVLAAVEAFRRGYTPIPLRARDKAPGVSQWTQITYDTEAEVRERFADWTRSGLTNLGLALGEPSRGLVDIDLDHPSTTALKHIFLPPTAMRSGRPSRPLSHYWYRVEGELPGTRRYKLPDGAVSLELRSTRAQTAVAPSVHPKGESYAWHGEPWGGDEGPAKINGQVLATEVALMGLAALLIEKWPREGGRHDAYLALAGGILRLGQNSVHPWWERNLPTFIRKFADATHDQDGPSRVFEVMDTTVHRLHDPDGLVQGWPTLARIIGEDVVDLAKRQVREVEALAGFDEAERRAVLGRLGDSPAYEEETAAQEETPEPESEHFRQMLDDELGWGPINWEPFISGERPKVEPELLRRTDGAPLLYPNTVNFIYGKSESAKSWLALYVCIQEMARGERVMYLDFENVAGPTFDRLRALGVGNDDIQRQVYYKAPLTPLASMMARWPEPPAESRRYEAEFNRWVTTFDPAVIVIDGMTSLLTLHEHESFKADGTTLIIHWLRRLMLRSRATVIIIDHTARNAVRGAEPYGTTAKRMLTRGSQIQVWAIDQPAPGAIGRVELVLTKDNNGGVRAHSVADPGETTASAGTFVLDGTDPENVRVHIEPPREGMVQMDLSDGKAQERLDRDRRKREAEARSEAVARERRGLVVDAFGEDAGPLRATDFQAFLSVTRTEWQNVWIGVMHDLLERGALERSGARANTSYRLVNRSKAGTAPEDD